jgi:hypothetical protein
MADPPYKAAFTPDAALGELRNEVRKGWKDASERTFNLRPGGLLALDRAVPHEVTALEESAILLTIAWHGRD